MSTFLPGISMEANGCQIATSLREITDLEFLLLPLALIMVFTQQEHQSHICPFDFKCGL